MKTLQTILLTCLAAGAALDASAATLSIAASEDTILRGGTQAGNNYGGAQVLLAGTLGNGDGLHDLFRFSLTDPSLAGATINSVTLNLYATGNDGTSQASLTLNVHQLTAANSDWVEGNSNDASEAGASSWSLKRSGASPTTWAGSAGASTPGTDYIETTLASFTGNPQTITAGTQMAFTSQTAFRSAVQGNVGGNLNLWLGAAGGDAGARNFFRIASSENPTVANRPTLTIDFTPVPEPSAALSLLSGFGMLAFRRRRAAVRA